MIAKAQPIEIEHHGNVALVRIRAGKANAMNVRLLDALDATLEALRDASAVVFTGDGNSFSAGLALPELIDLDRRGIGDLIDRFEATMQRVLEFPHATVAAINGHAFAGGCVFALMCDLRVMAAGGAKIGLNEVQLGIGLPAIVIEPLRLRVSPSAVNTIALDGTLFGTVDALRIQLVDELVEPAALATRAIELATARATAPQAYAQIKRALLAPVVAACAARRLIDREAWLDTWFSDHAQRTLRAAVARITTR